jgi:hypothetical protein
VKQFTKKEKRQYPRIYRQLPLKVVANGYDFVTSTQNVSCVGAYCQIDKYVPPFTKVAVKLTLPISTAGGNKDCSVECRGVVVRAEDDKDKNSFNIAIFFNQIKRQQRKIISQYINQYFETPT